MNDSTYYLIFSESLEKLLGSGNWYKNNLISKFLKDKKNKDALLQKIKDLKLNKDLKTNDIFTSSQLRQLKEKNINPFQGNINLKLSDVQNNKVENIAENDSLILEILDAEYCVKNVHVTMLNEIIFSGYKWGDIRTFGIYRFNFKELLIEKIG